MKPRSVTAGLINVDDLQSVNSKTGNLSLTGSLTLTTAGVIKAGQTAYDTGVGYYLEFNGGTPRLSLGNSGGNKLLWDGTSLSITGTITATTGTIGGWTIGATDLTGSAGVIGLASSGSIRIWSGHATPASAPFQVSSLGALTATSGAIGGWTIDGTSGLLLGSGASTRGISTGSVAFYAGSATPSTAPFNVTTAGAVSMSNLTMTGGSINVNSGVFQVSSAGAVTASNLTITGGSINVNSGAFQVSSAGALTATNATITGAITATSGSFTGSITASGGTIGGITIGATSLSSSGWSLTNAGVMTSTSGTIGGLAIGTSSLTVASGKSLIFGGGNGELNYSGIMLVPASAIDYNRGVQWRASFPSGTLYGAVGASALYGMHIASTYDVIFENVDGTQYHIFGAYGSNPGIYQAKSYIYPGSGSAFNNTYAIGYSASPASLVLQGPVNFTNHTTGGSAANWSSFGTANIPDKSAGYVIVYINGTACRVPFYANG